MNSATKASYRLTCKSFSEVFMLGKLAYISDPSCIQSNEKNVLKCLKEEQLLPENKGLFSIQDNKGNILLLSSYIMFMIESLRKNILRCIADQMFKILNNLKLPTNDQIIFEFIHPICDGKCFTLMCVYREIGDSVIYEVIMSYSGLNENTLPDLRFPLPGFEQFLKNFFPCISLYTCDIAIHNYALPTHYQGILEKVNRELYSDIVTNRQFTKFIADHCLTVHL